MFTVKTTCLYLGAEHRIHVMVEMKQNPGGVVGALSPPRARGHSDSSPPPLSTRACQQLRQRSPPSDKIVVFLKLKKKM